MEVKNDLTLKIFSSGTTEIYDLNNDLLKGRGLWFSTGYPGGLAGLGAGVDIPRDPRRWWEVKGTLRAVLLNGQKMVYEGKIPNLQSRMSASEMGMYIDMMGLWGFDLMSRELRKRWADSRVDDQTWEYQTDGAADLCNPDRRSRLRFLPKSETWTINTYAAYRYTIPTGTIPRVEYAYDLAEGGQAWEISLWRSTDATSWTLVSETNGDTIDGAATTTQITASGTGTIGADLDGSPKYLELRYYARAGQTPTSDGAYYANITDLMVYGSDPGTDGIRLKLVCEDLISEFPDLLNSSTNHLTEMSSIFEIDPFITAGDGYESLASVLMRAADLGDGNQERWAVGLLPSDSVASPDGKPVLFMEAFPDTEAGFEHIISIDSKENLVGEFLIERDFDRAFYNYIRVSWTDERGYTRWVGPVIAPTLKDQDSIDEFGQHDFSLQLGNSTQEKAINAGVSFLSENSQPPWVLRSPIVVQGWIEGQGGRVTPACRIQAGERIKVRDYDTFWISRTRYVHDPVPTCSIYVGAPQESIFRESIFAMQWDDPVPGDGDSGEGAAGGGGGKIWQHLGLNKNQYLDLKRRGLWGGVKSAAQQAWRKGEGFKRWRKYYKGSAPF